MLDQKRIGEKLRKYRKDLGLTQQEVADRANVSAQAVSKWESGECLPDIFNLKSIGDIYDISIDELLETKKDLTFKKDIKIFEERLKKVEKAISIVSAPNHQAQLSRILDGSQCYYSFDFTEAEKNFAPWVLEGAEVTDTEGALSFKTATESKCFGSYYSPVLSSPDISLDSSKAKFIHIWFKSNPEENNQMQTLRIYFRTDFENYFNERNKILNMYLPNDNGDYFCADFSQHFGYKGKITGLRFDLLDNAGEIGIKRIVVTDKATLDANVLFEADFTKEKGFENSGFMVENATILSTDSLLLYQATKLERILEVHDQRLINDEINLDIDSTNARYVRARFKVNVKDAYKPHSRVYFKTKEDNEYSQNKSVPVFLLNNKMNDVYFDMKRNPEWHGTLTGLRIDLLEGEGDMTIELIEVLLETPETAIGSWAISVDDRLYKILGKGNLFNFNSLEEYLHDMVHDVVNVAVQDALGGKAPNETTEN